MHISFPISSPYIELSKLLKASGVVDSGGEAKVYIDQGKVLRNGTIEHRKKAKILVGEIISGPNRSITIVP